MKAAIVPPMFDRDTHLGLRPCAISMAVPHQVRGPRTVWSGHGKKKQKTKNKPKHADRKQAVM